MTKINELLLNEIFEHFGVSDYDVVQIISREVWKKKYDGVMKQLVAPKGWRTRDLDFGDEKKFWKPEKEVIKYGLGGIYYVGGEEKQMITRSQSRKYPKGHMYSIRSKEGNVWITEDEVELYRKTKNAWARDTHNKSLWEEVWEDRTARTFLNSYYLSHFAKLFRIPKSERRYGDPDGKSWWCERPDPWEKVWRFHRVEDAPKFLKV